MEVQAPTNLRIVVDEDSEYSSANSQTEETITIGNTQIELTSSTAFSINDPDSIIAPTIMIWENSPYTVINKDIGINIRIPSELNCTWSQSENIQIEILRNEIDISADIIETTNISEDSKLLVVSILEDLDASDTVKISGSFLNNFTSISFPNVISMAVTNPEA